MTPKAKKAPLITDFSKSDALCRRAQQLIPGGAHTYAKGADHSPALGPKFIARGKGSRVWDVDGNEYVDWAMGLGSVSLGHAHEPVLSAVRAQLPLGSSFQCPSPIEVELAEHFLSQVPGAEMVKFAKNGSTVTTAAVKLARAYTGRKIAAFCSDHGFFSYDDWYIGKRPNNAGVPREISDLSRSFRYNDIASVESLFRELPGQVAAVILEPMEYELPREDFLLKLQKLCRAQGAVLILDEMVTGFRLGYPGAHARFKVQPDLTAWGKGVANGFSACMLAGRRELMEAGGNDHKKERVFLLSTTHGAETHALAAALAALKELERLDAVGCMRRNGERLREGLEALIKARGLGERVSVLGEPANLAVRFRDQDGKDCEGFRTLVFQETVKRGVLFRGYFMSTPAHGEPDFERTFEAFDAAFAVYAKALDAGGYRRFLVGDPVKPVFRKYC